MYQWISILNNPKNKYFLFNTGVIKEYSYLIFF